MTVDEVLDAFAHMGANNVVLNANVSVPLGKPWKHRWKAYATRLDGTEISHAYGETYEKALEKLYLNEVVP